MLQRPRAAPDPEGSRMVVFARPDRERVRERERERIWREKEASFFDDELQSRRENRVIDLSSASRKRNE
jgi:hypothetical protein